MFFFLLLSTERSNNDLCDRFKRKAANGNGRFQKWSFCFNTFCRGNTTMPAKYRCILLQKCFISVLRPQRRHPLPNRYLIVKMRSNANLIRFFIWCMCSVFTIVQLTDLRWFILLLPIRVLFPSTCACLAFCDYASQHFDTMSTFRQIPLWKNSGIN